VFPIIPDFGCEISLSHRWKHIPGFVCKNSFIGLESGTSRFTTCILQKDVVQEYVEKKYLLTFAVAECMNKGDAQLLFVHERFGLSLFPNR
jgi:hypothetical protein